MYACVCVYVPIFLHIHKYISSSLWVCVCVSCSLSFCVCKRTEYDCGGCTFAFLHHLKIDNVNESSSSSSRKKIILHMLTTMFQSSSLENRKRHFPTHTQFAFSLTESKPSSSSSTPPPPPPSSSSWLSKQCVRKTNKCIQHYYTETLILSMLIEISGHIKCTCFAHCTRCAPSTHNECERIKWSAKFHLLIKRNLCVWVPFEFGNSAIVRKSNSAPYAFLLLAVKKRKQRQQQQQPMSRCGTDKILCALLSLYAYACMFFSLNQTKALFWCPKKILAHQWSLAGWLVGWLLALNSSLA